SAHPKNLVAQTPLLVSTLRGDGSANMTPLCACSENPFIPRWLPFDAWWRDEVIFQDGDFRLNRQRLVFALRNKEGGGHFDAVVTDKSYLQLAREYANKWRASFSGQSIRLLDSQFATMRQVAWELMETLKLWDYLERASRAQSP